MSDKSERAVPVCLPHSQSTETLHLSAIFIKTSIVGLFLPFSYADIEGCGMPINSFWDFPRERRSVFMRSPKSDDFMWRSSVSNYFNIHQE